MTLLMFSLMFFLLNPHTSYLRYQCPPYAFGYFSSSTQHNQESPQKRESPLRLACGHGCGELCWLMINVGGFSPLWAVPFLEHKPGAKGAWASKQLSFMISAPSSCLSSFLNFLRDGLLPGSVGWNQPFPPPSCFWSCYLSQQQRNELECRSFFPLTSHSLTQHLEQSMWNIRIWSFIIIYSPWRLSLVWLLPAFL